MTAGNVYKSCRFFQTCHLTWVMAPRRASVLYDVPGGIPTGVSGGVKDGIFTRAFQKGGNKWTYGVPSDLDCASGAHHVAILCPECLTTEAWKTD